MSDAIREHLRATYPRSATLAQLAALSRFAANDVHRMVREGALCEHRHGKHCTYMLACPTRASDLAAKLFEEARLIGFRRAYNSSGRARGGATHAEQGQERDELAIATPDGSDDQLPDTIFSPSVRRRLNPDVPLTRLGLHESAPPADPAPPSLASSAGE